MQQSVCAACAALLLSALCQSAGIAGGTISADRPKRPVQTEEAGRVIATLKSRGLEIYETYIGVESLRTETVKEYDPATGALKSTSEVTMKRKDYFYRAPEIEVVSYTKDGKEMNPSKFRVMKSKPTHPVFDAHGDEHYSTTLEDTVRINGAACYRVRVTPKKETMRHFSGDMFFKKDTLESVLIEGTVAKLDFPLTSFKIELQMVPLDRVPVVQSGTVQVRVNVPVFYPDTMIVTTIATRESRLMR